jgi:hypothetical protein
MPSAGDQWCSHGTVNSGAAAYAVIDATAALPPPLDIPGIFSIIFSALGVVSIATSDLCSNPPRYPGDPSFQDVVDWSEPLKQPAVAEKYLQLLIYYVWPQFCTCDTFVPPATVYPPPPVFPTPAPALPSQTNPLDLTCNLSAITSKLNSILGLLRLIAATVGPQSYELGNTHTVTGTGEITVSGIVGCVTHALSYAPGIGYVLSDPTRFFEAGFIAFGDSNGWYARQPNIHDPQFHTGLPTGITRIGFDCGMVTSMEITELLPVVLYQGN